MLLENHPYPQDGRVRREATSLARAGYSVTVISPGRPDQPRSETINGVKIYRYPQPAERDGFIGYLMEYGYSMVAIAILTVWVAFRSGFDVIHAHNPPDTLAIIAAPFKLAGKKFVFDHHDLSPEMYDALFGEAANPKVRRLLSLFERLTYKLADHVIATNQSYRAMALGRGGKEVDQVTIVRNGPEIARVKTAEPDAELRQRASTIIGYVGVMGYQDGVDYLIRALDRLRTELGRDDFYCVIVGSGVAVPSLQQLTADLELDSHVWFTGRISDEALMRYMSTVDICVDPDPYNAFNDRSSMIKMTEYMALGKPIVAFDLTEHRYTAGESALYAAANDELDFAKKLAALMDDPELRRTMGELGRDRVANHLAWPHQEASLLEAYRRLTTEDAS